MTERVELAGIDLNPGEASHRGAWEDADGRMWQYALAWRRSGGRFECVKLLLAAPDGQVISATSLRRFPVGRLMEESRRSHEALAQWAAEAVPGRREEQLADARLWEKSRAGRSGPKGYGAEHFVEVATIYQREALLGRKPTQAVARHFVVSKSAAAKWVAKARTMGLLPPAQKGKAG